MITTASKLNQIQFRLGCRIIAIVLLATFHSATPSFSADWPQMFGPNRDGHSAETGLNWNWKQSPPKIVWKIPVGRGFAGVAVANDTVWLFHRKENQEILTALAAETGKELFSVAEPTRYRDDFDFDDGPRCVPVVLKNQVATLGANGDLRLTDVAKRETVWQKNLLTTYKANKGYFGVGSGPLAVDDRLLINVGGPEAGVVAFDTATGKELGKAGTDPAGYSTPILAELDGKPTAVFFTRTGLLAVDPKTMQVRWQKRWRSRLDASVNAATPLAIDGDLFLTASYGTGAVRLQPKPGETEPEEVWAGDNILSCHYNTPVYQDGYLYGIDGRQEGGAARLRCVNWATGKVEWSQDRFGCAALIVVDNGILAVNEKGELVRFAANPKAYTEEGRFPLLNGPVRAAPALSNSLLFVRNETELVCLSLRKPKE